MRPTLATALLLVVAASFVAVGFVRHEARIHEQRTLARIASEIAGRRVGVRCPGFIAALADTRGEAGRVQFDDAGRPADHTDLSPETCAQLRKIRSVDFSCLDRHACGYREFRAGWAAHTLAHEAFHLRGIEDEGVTECYGLQNTSFVAQQLGVPRAHADALQRWLFEQGYPNEPTDYHAAGCYAGGPLDLSPATPPWP